MTGMVDDFFKLAPHKQKRLHDAYLRIVATFLYYQIFGADGETRTRTAYATTPSR